jgi:hypothetical protein
MRMIKLSRVMPAAAAQATAQHGTAAQHMIASHQLDEQLGCHQ